jgi:hypothetical protein
MPRRTDAVRCRVVIHALLALAAGCATVARREPTPTSAPAPLPELTAAEPLAITEPPRLPDPVEAVKPAAFAPPPAAPADAPRRLHREAATAYARQPSYIARLRRREWANGKPKPEETLIFKFREQPWSVHFKWLGEEGQGREVLYVRGKHGDKLHVLTAANDIPFTPAGRRMAFAPNSVLVRSASRYPITEAGIGRVIERFGRLLDAVDRKQPGAVATTLGPTARPEYASPLDGVECQLPPNFAPEVPQGGKRLVFFDPSSKFPVVSATYDSAGQEVDYACFDRLQLGVRLDDDDFHPDKLWGKRP